MSSPSPVPQSGTDHTYQPSDSSDHALINHPCQCSEVPNIDSSKSESTVCHSYIPNKCKLNHHHNLVNISTHGSSNTTHSHPNNQSVHVHVHAPPNSTLTKQPPSNCNCHIQLENETNTEIRQATPTNRKVEADDRIEVSPLPPALPPRPPPRPRTEGRSTLESRSRIRETNANTGGIRKYVFWCCVCGGLATVLGALFLAVYFLLRSYTSTLGYFETIPTFVPATMLILTGLCVICLARRKNRYSYLIKVCGLCCLVCALTCVLVTITTTVIHMNRLQTLRECVYTQKTRTCTCYSVLLEAHASTDEGMRFVFDSTPDCEVIHGALYSCLRAMFGLSVSGILVCIFSCMLIYQLLSHEKKKMYWEQLELRCRSLYQHSGAPPSTHSSMRGPSTTYCSCCEECRYPPLTSGTHLYPWDTHPLERFWTPGRVGNFYSPNPGEEGIQPPGESQERERSNGGWNWRRLPWNRGNTTQHAVTDSNRDSSLTYQGGMSSSDSQYGFGNQQGNESRQNSSDPVSGSTGSYSVLDNRPVGGVYVWGPPPPYSNPNSPARRPFHSPSRYHHVHHHLHAHNAHCQISNENQNQPFSHELHLRRSRMQHSNKENYENTLETEVHQSNDNSESTDTSSCIDHIPHTLTVRKMKKRADVSSVKSINQLSNNRTNVQNVFNQNCHNFSGDNQNSSEHGYHDSNAPDGHQQMPNDNQQCRFLPRLQGVENAAFQNQESPTAKPETTESEVYFADVSSCCNISVKNDGQDSSVYDEALDMQKPRLIQLQNMQGSLNEKELATNNQILQNFQENISSSTVTEDEEYLAHRLGKRQMSTRSRLPFPLPNADDVCDIHSDPCIQLLPKDISQNSLCSNVQTPLTETTDDTVSPGSPTTQNINCMNYFEENNCSVEPVHINQCHANFSNSNLDQFLAPDAQYEIIQEQSSPPSFKQSYTASSSLCASPATFSNLTNTISSLNTFGQNYLPSNFNNQNVNKNFNFSSPKNVPPKTLNLNQSSNRKNLGSNISSLIQNLGVNPVGLLYGEANSTEDEEVQCQGCHSDGTMDSGWHSGSEKQERNQEKNDNCTHRAVNV